MVAISIKEEKPCPNIFTKPADLETGRWYRGTGPQDGNPGRASHRIYIMYKAPDFTLVIRRSYGGGQSTHALNNTAENFGPEEIHNIRKLRLGDEIVIRITQPE